MTCTATADVTGLVTILTTINTTLTGIQTALQNLNDHTITNGLAASLFSINGYSATVAGVVASAQFNVNIGSGGTGIDTAINTLRQALVADGFTIPGFDRITADKSASLGQRLVQDLDFDAAHADLGAIGDRLGPTPTDDQCDATDTAWAPNPSTDNIADQVNNIAFVVGNDY